MIPFLGVGCVFVAAFCLLISALLLTSSSNPTPTQGIPTAQAQQTATAQAACTSTARALQATPPTRLPTLPPSATPSPARTSAHSLLPFIVQDDQAAFQAYSGGCDWLGVAGQVFDSEGDPLSGLRVHVWGEMVNEAVLSGSSPDFGAGGWVVKLAEATRVGRYSVQLLSSDDSPLSEVLTFETRDSCDANLVVVNFAQNQPIDDAD
jgi:hypothetical protein